MNTINTNYNQPIPAEQVSGQGAVGPAASSAPPEAPQQAQTAQTPQPAQTEQNTQPAPQTESGNSVNTYA